MPDAIDQLAQFLAREFRSRGWDSGDWPLEYWQDVARAVACYLLDHGLKDDGDLRREGR